MYTVIKEELSPSYLASWLNSFAKNGYKLITVINDVFIFEEPILLKEDKIYSNNPCDCCITKSKCSLQFIDCVSDGFKCFRGYKLPSLEKE